MLFRSLAGNQLHSLPASLAQCRQLALLRMAANRFDRLPDCLLSLPKLAWLACAGNPSAPASAVRALLRDPDEHVRALAAAHAQAAPADLLEVVLHDTFAGPKLAALRNPNCDPAALDLACGDPDLVLIAARNRSCSPDALVTALATMSVEDVPAQIGRAHV